VVSSDNLRAGHAVSCGCARRGRRLSWAAAAARNAEIVAAARRGTPYRILAGLHDLSAMTVYNIVQRAKARHAW
jgi:hypothetical protein